MIDIYCLNCLKPIKSEGSIKDMFYVNDVLCGKCRSKMQTYKKEIKIDGLKIFGLYPYQGLFRDLLLQYKEYRDEALFCVFLYPFVKHFNKKYHDYYLVEVPSNRKSIYRRGFRHVKQIYSLSNLKMLDLFEKRNDVQQKYLPLYMRKEISNSFVLKNNIDISDKKILLVDDVVTSGNSLTSCYNLIKNKCKKVEGFVLGYNVSYLNKWEKWFIKVFL